MLDALNRRKKFQGRQPTGQRIDLTPRDLAYFAALERHGPLSGPVLYEFAKSHAHNERGHKDRLTALYHESKTPHGGPYLERPEQQFAAYNARCQPMVYELTNASRLALRQADIPKQAAMPPSGPYLHRFMTAAITAKTEIDAVQNGLRFVASGEIIQHPKCPESTRSASNPLAIRAAGRVIIPDALYGIDYGGKYRFWALEADRGTESLRGRSRASRYIADKIEAYHTLFRADLHRAVWGIPVLAVRVVCESETRAENIRSLIRQMPITSSANLFCVEALVGSKPYAFAVS
jgi:Replication-relaxation